MAKMREKPPEKVWADFKELLGLPDEQLAKFRAYEAMLTDWNTRMNLTAISGLSETVSRHFVDSLSLQNFIDLKKVTCIADVGSGAGFPGIPLKIMYPQVQVILLEVTRKKQEFLQAVIRALGLKDIEVCELDWRTFLRTTESKVEYFVARASLDPVELCRLCKPGCSYKHAKLVYWATHEWQPDPEIKGFVLQEFPYELKRQQRKLVLMGLNAQ